jgi:hypothetical protein
MGIALSHVDMGPLLYGIVMFIGLAITFYKFTRGKLLAVAIDIAVFWLVFSLHGHSMTGGFAAMICALLAGTFFPMMLRR